VKGLGRVGKVAFVVGALVWLCVAGITKPMYGGSEGDATFVRWALLVAPMGLVAGALVAWAGYGVGLRGWIMESLWLWVVPTLANGLFWSALVKSIGNPPTKGRLRFWVIVIGFGVFWVWMVTWVIPWRR
jgi:hypothetical protein